MRNLFRFIFYLSLIFTLFACNSGGSTGTANKNGGIQTLYIDAAESVVHLSGSLKLHAYATYANESNPVDVTDKVKWQSSKPGIATISESGVLIPHSMGSTDVSAGFASLQASKVIDVRQATLLSVEIDPNLPSVAKGSSMQLKAVGAFDDGTKEDLTTVVNWSSGDKGIASVDDKGVATGLKLGLASVKIAYKDKESTVPFEVRRYQNIAIEKAPVMWLGHVQPINIIASESDGSSVIISNPTAYNMNLLSSNPAAASFDESSNILVANKVGQTTITARYGIAIESTISVDVRAKQFAYLVSDKNLVIYENESNGGLNELGKASIKDGSQIITDPAHRFIYLSTRHYIEAYSFNRESGALTKINDALTDSSVSHMVISPSGKFLYAMNEKNMRVYDLDPESGTIGAQIQAIRVNGSHFFFTPDGKYAYATGADEGVIQIYTIGHDGKLYEPQVYASPLKNSFDQMAFYPDSMYVFATNPSANKVVAFRINPESGALTAVGNVSVTSAHAIGVTADNAYVLVGSSNSVYSYKFDHKSGKLSKVDEAKINVAIPEISIVPGLQADLSGGNFYVIGTYEQKLLSFNALTNGKLQQNDVSIGSPSKPYGLIFN